MYQLLAVVNPKLVGEGGYEKLLSLSCFKILCNDPITHTLSLSHIPRPCPATTTQKNTANTHSSILGFP